MPRRPETWTELARHSAEIESPPNMEITQEKSNPTSSRNWGSLLVVKKRQSLRKPRKNPDGVLKAARFELKVNAGPVLELVGCRITCGRVAVNVLEVLR